MAYLVPIAVCECNVCGKRATHTLYDRRSVKMGDYCKPCGDMMRLEEQAVEYYEVD